jgi:DNA-binding MarR family transcriptional regulator
MVHGTNVDDLATVLYDGIALTARRLRQLATPTDLSLPERSALSRLDRGGPATAAELARAEQISPQAMAVTLAALERRDFVARQADPHDRRRIILSATDAGREVLRQRRDARARQVALALDERFTAAELDTLRAAAPLLERLGEGI